MILGAMQRRCLDAWRLARLFAVALPLLALTGCACYRSGADSLYPADIDTVYVPVFKSRSFRQFEGERLTEAVVKEITDKTPFKVVTQNPDSVLEGEIVAESKRVIVKSPTDEAREVEVTYTVQVTWVDSRGTTLRDTQSVAIPNSLVNVMSTTGAVAEVGQSMSSQQQRAIEQLAEQIVALMEVPW
jgi:hypothetical protein